MNIKRLTLQMQMSYKKIGKILHTHGINGNVVLAHSLVSGKSFLKLKHVFIALQPNSFIPFFPVRKPRQINNENLIFEFEDIQSVQEAQPLLGKEVFIEEDLFKKEFSSQNQVDNMDLKGFRIWDKRINRSGIITSVMTLPGQIVATVDCQNKEILIPIAENFIVEFDVARQILTMELPEGIWDL